MSLLPSSKAHDIQGLQRMCLQCVCVCAHFDESVVANKVSRIAREETPGYVGPWMMLDGKHCHGTSTIFIVTPRQRLVEFDLERERRGGWDQKIDTQVWHDVNP